MESFVAALCSNSIGSANTTVRDSPVSANWCVTFVLAHFHLARVSWGFVIDRLDPLHCDALMTEGSWLDDKFKNWQPEGASFSLYLHSNYLNSD